MIPLLLGLLQEPLLPDGNALVRDLLGRQRAREEALNRYTYDLTEARDELDGKGAVKSRRTRSYEIFWVKGRPVRKLVAENGAPLGPEARDREERRVREVVEAIVAGESAREEPFARLSRILERYDFRTVSREDLEGRRTLRLQFEPRPGKRDLEGDALLRKMEGRIWVDEEEGQLARMELENQSKIKFALGLAASVSSVDVTIDFAKMEDGIWLPRRVEIEAAGRKLLVKAFRLRRTLDYGRYRRFETETEETVPSPDP